MEVGSEGPQWGSSSGPFNEQDPVWDDGAPESLPCPAPKHPRSMWAGGCHWGGGGNPQAGLRGPKCALPGVYGDGDCPRPQAEVPAPPTLHVGVWCLRGPLRARLGQC